MTRLRADVLLLLAAIIWGSTFVAQKDANLHMAPVLYTGVRFLLSALLLTPFALYEAKKGLPRLDRIDLGLAMLAGLGLFSGIATQQTGLVTTSATNAGFLTALYVILVPFFEWVFRRKRPRPIVLFACLLSIAGAWLLAGNGSFAHKWAKGDVLVLAGDVGWAADIILVSVFFSRAQRPFFLAFMQYAVTGILGCAFGAGFEPLDWHGMMQAAPDILYAGIFSGGIAYTLQIVAQRYTPAAEASIIMSLESLFAAVSGAFFLGERLSYPAMAGCALILVSVVAVETGPAMMKKRYAMIRELHKVPAGTPKA
ncbi:MAG: DMT family transporter [Alphaproteobacteria bacterium]|nr:DMT family transporter [Alphaproteobacteria bacterium]